MRKILILLTEYMIEKLDEAVKRNYAANRNVAIRDAIRDYLKEMNLW